jgi:hypothetical protein
VVPLPDLVCLPSNVTGWVLGIYLRTCDLHTRLCEKTNLRDNKSSSNSNAKKGQKLRMRTIALSLTRDTENNHGCLVVAPDDRQLHAVLKAYAHAFQESENWVKWMLLDCKGAGLACVHDLVLLQERSRQQQRQQPTVQWQHQQQRVKSEPTIYKLSNFVLGPRGLLCFQLACAAAMKVEHGTADTHYVHRRRRINSSSSSSTTNDATPGARIKEEKPNESFQVNSERWIVNVDCAGLIRCCLEHVLWNNGSNNNNVKESRQFAVALSDRDFMRAKDFFFFYDTLPYSITDQQHTMDLPAPRTSALAAASEWRRVPDLRMVLAGDIICYRPKGNAAGGSAFTYLERNDLDRCLRAVQTAYLWNAETGRRSDHVIDANGRQWRNHITQNVASDPRVAAWVEATKVNLSLIGIGSVLVLYWKLDTINEQFQRRHLTPLLDDAIVDLLRECCESTSGNTGHIVFAAGPAVNMGPCHHSSINSGRETGSASDAEYRIRVVHSTRRGKTVRGTTVQGVQEYYRRFQLVQNQQGEEVWTRAMAPSKPLVSSSSSSIPSPQKTPRDDPGGVEVIAARMCF